MCQTHSKQTKFTEDLGSKNINAQTQLLIAQRLYHRGAQTDQKEEATWKLKEQHRIEKSQCKSQNSSNPPPTNWAFLSQKPERRTEWSRWTDPRMNISTVWHWESVMTWMHLSSSTTEVEEVPACTPWSCGTHFCKSCCWNITWNNVTTLITHLQRRDRKRKRFKESCKIHEETEEPALRKGCKSLICLT